MIFNFQKNLKSSGSKKASFKLKKHSKLIQEILIEFL